MADARAGDDSRVATRGDLGRRVLARRQELGLTREEVARRTGSAPGYVGYVEEHSSLPGSGFLLRLADALQTSPAELTGGTAELPPGLGKAARAPELVALKPWECWELLSDHGVGRIAMSTAGGPPTVVPVNYTCDGEQLAFRTAPGSVAAAAAGHEAAIEVDRLDEAFSEGWSVLVMGYAHEVHRAADVNRLEEQAHTMPWAGGDRTLWITLVPARITGRRIRAHRGS